MFGDPISVNLERHDDIRRKLRARGVKLIDIAAETKRHPSLVTQTSQGYRQCPEIERAIANRLQIPVATLFPERNVAAKEPEDQS